MDAVLKHLGLRSDFIVCHPDVIDDPLFHAPRPPPPSPTHPCSLLQPFTSPSYILLSSAAFSAHLLGIFKHEQHLCGSRSMQLIFLSLNFLTCSWSKTINSLLLA